MPFVYETVGGLSNLQANLLQAVLWIFTALAGYFGFAMYGDKVSHRGFYFVGAAMAVISWLILTYVGMSWTALIAFVVIWGISAGIGAQLGTHYGQQNYSQLSIVQDLKVLCSSLFVVVQVFGPFSSHLFYKTWASKQLELS